MPHLGILQPFLPFLPFLPGPVLRDGARGRDAEAGATLKRRITLARSRLSATALRNGNGETGIEGWVNNKGAGIRSETAAI